LSLTFHFLPYSFTFLTCFSQLPFLPICSPCCLCFSAAVRVSWTDRVYALVLPKHTRSNPYPNAETQARLAIRPPPADQGQVRARESVLQPLSPMLCGLCIPPTTWAPCTAVDTKQSHEPYLFVTLRSPKHTLRFFGCLSLLPSYPTIYLSRVVCLPLFGCLLAI
jgi:hypothetical protein